MSRHEHIPQPHNTRWSLCNPRPSVLGSLYTSLLILATSAWADLERPRYTGIENEGRGKSGIAVARGNEALFLNPAGLAALDSSRWTAHTGGTIGLNAVLLDYASWAIHNADAMGEPSELLKRMEPIDSKWAPFSNYFVAEASIGRAAYTIAADVEYSLTAVQGALTPVVGVGASSDLIFAGGYGREVGHGWQVGGSLQFTHMTRYPRRIIGFMDEDLYTVMDVLKDDNASTLDKMEAASSVAVTGVTFGANLGVAKKLPRGWYAGATVSDAPVATSLGLGVGWERQLPALGRMQSTVRTALDWTRIFAPDTRWFEQPRMGVQLDGSYKRRPVGYLSTGFHDGYPCFGVGMGYWALLEYTYFRRELGNRPGQDPLAYHKITFSLRI